MTSPRPLKLEKPEVLQFPVIDICNSRCQMCRIWENKNSQDVSLEELEVGLSSDLFSEVVSVGFNGGEPTLRKDLPELIALVSEKLPKLRSVSLITNAFKYEQVINQITEIGIILKDKGISFDVMVSLDGYGEVHDRVRGREGNFQRAQRVIEFVQASEWVDSLRIGCTVIRENVYHLHDLLDYCVRQGLYIKFRLGVPHQRLYTENITDPYALTYDEKCEFVEFLEGLSQHYEGSSLQKFFYRSLADQLALNAPRRAGCDWKHRGATITARGELAFCAVKSNVLSSSIANSDLEETYFANEPHLRSIIKNECDTCHHDYVGIPDGADYLRLAIDELDMKFRLREAIRTLPGYRLINGVMESRLFSRELAKYRSVQKQIRVNASSSVELNDKQQRVMICGWYGTETLGDKGILAGVLKSIRNALGQNVHFFVASLFPYITQRTCDQMAELQDVQIVSIEQAMSLVSTVDLLTFGGGPLMSIPSMAPMEALFERARESGVQTLAAGIGVGPLGNKAFDESVGRTLKLCDNIIFRDKRSADAALALGVDTKDATVAEDPAFTWLIDRISGSPNVRENLGRTLLLGLRDFPYREYARELEPGKAKELKKNYERSVVEAVSSLLIQFPDLVIKPLPMCTNHFGGDDRWFYRKLFRRLEKVPARLDMTLLNNELRPNAYVDEFVKADVVLAMRFHSLVFGLSAGANCIAIDYTMGRGKVKSLAEKTNTPVIGMGSLDAQVICQQVSNALSRPAEPNLEISSLQFDTHMKNVLGSAMRRNDTGKIRASN